MGCDTTVKISYIIYNILLAIVGIGTLVWIITCPDSFNKVSEIGTYVICALIILFSLLGIFAAIRESVRLIVVCVVFLLILVLLQIPVTCFQIIGSETRSGIAVVSNAWETNTIDELQIKYECCGKSSAQDYILLNRKIPLSCYEHQDERNSDGLFIAGCNEKLEDFYDTETLRLAIYSWILIGFEILGIMLGIFLIINIRNKQRRMQF